MYSPAMLRQVASNKAPKAPPWKNPGKSIKSFLVCTKLFSRLLARASS